jgi:hypothetical protein
MSSSSQKYELIYNIISKQNAPDNSHNMCNNTTSIDLLPNASSDDNMKLELKNFIKNQMNQSEMNQSEMGTTNISDIDYNMPM